MEDITRDPSFDPSAPPAAEEPRPDPQPEIERLRAIVQGYGDALVWALGVGDDFPPLPDDWPNRKFYWRTELRRRVNAVISAAGASAPLPASSPQAEPDTDDHAAAILQSVLMMIGLPGFKAKWFVDGRWDLGEIRRYGLDDRLAEIRKAEAKLKAQGEPAASSPQPDEPTEEEINRLEKAAWDANVDRVLVWYRQRIADLQSALTESRAERDMRDVVLYMAVARLGGYVEGRPTERVNFLQRIDELVQKEAAASSPAQGATVDGLRLALRKIAAMKLCRARAATDTEGARLASAASDSLHEFACPYCTARAALRRPAAQLPPQKEDHARVEPGATLPPTGTTAKTSHGDK